MSRQKNLEDSIALITGGLAGSNLLESVKELLVEDVVLAKLFGSKGESIYINRNPNGSSQHLPFLEMWFGSEVIPSPNGKMTGTVDGQILFPSHNSVHGDKQERLERHVAWAIIRYMDTRNFYRIFDMVDGLEEFGAGAQFNYNKKFVSNHGESPAITFKLPYKIDLARFKAANPEIDFNSPLDAEEFGDYLITEIELLGDEVGEVIETQQTNHGGDNV